MKYITGKFGTNGMTLKHIFFFFFVANVLYPKLLAQTNTSHRLTICFINYNHV